MLLLLLLIVVVIYHYNVHYYEDNGSANNPVISRHFSRPLLLQLLRARASARQRWSRRRHQREQQLRLCCRHVRYAVGGRVVGGCVIVAVFRYSLGIIFFELLRGSIRLEIHAHQTSHVTRHTSHLTPHTSHLTRYTATMSAKRCSNA